MNSIEMIEKCMGHQLYDLVSGGVYLEWTNIGVEVIRDSAEIPRGSMRIIIPMIAIKSIL